MSLRWPVPPPPVTRPRYPRYRMMLTARMTRWATTCSYCGREVAKGEAHALSCPQHPAFQSIPSS